MDVLSDVLDTVRVENGMLWQTDQVSPWGMALGSREQLAFHVVTRGHCWLSVDGLDGPLAIETGDVIVIAPWRAHALRDAPDTPARDIQELISSGQMGRMGEAADVAVPDGRTTTQLVCGWFGFADARSDLLIAALPIVLHARQQASDNDSWLAQTVTMLSYESRARRPGMTTVINRLCDALFVYVLRGHLAALTGEQPNWLRGLVDPQIGAALQLMHEDPGAPWTVGKLAAGAGMSRSAFSARFTRTVGEAPMQYLARWRLRKAAAMLRDHESDLNTISDRTGYSSGAAFSKAFTREHGIAPGAYRRATQTRRSAPD